MPRPATPHLSNRLRQLSLNSPPQTALFYARLYNSLCPLENDHESLHILALCLLEVGETYSSLHVVRDRADMGCSGCAMILARCCQKLGRFSEGQAALQRAMSRGNPMTLPTLDTQASAATAYLTLANLSHKGKVTAVAFENYKKALLEDPWSWEAFTGLCDIGYGPELDDIFPDPPAPSKPVSRTTQSQPTRQPTLSPNPMPRSSASEMPGFLPGRKQLSPLAGSGGGGGGGFFTPDVAAPAAKLGMRGQQTWETPSFAGDTTFQGIAAPARGSRRPLPGIISSLLPSGSLIPASFRPSATSTPVNPQQTQDWAPLPQAPAMKRPRAAGRKGDQIQNSMPVRSNGRDLKTIEPNGDADEVRRSSRLKTTVPSGKVVSKPARDRRAQRSQSVTSSASVEMTSPPSQDGLQSQADDWLRDIVRRCARAYRHLSVYACAEAIREIDTLSVEVQVSPWALEVTARAYYEMANYTVVRTFLAPGKGANPKARRVFERLLEAEPYRLDSLEHYSTFLWHLSDAPSLSALSQSLMSISRESTQAWISTGNLFSLQRDHDQAMRCFKRATQIDPGCVYAWTLCGYEAIEMEEYERAIAFYRTAIRTDGRHYNAWYGMGVVYAKTGKLRHAEHHYRRAADINPSNAVLLSSIGSVLEQLDQENDGDSEGQALKYYELACKYAPDSPMIQFRRIRYLVSLDKIDEAISALEPLSKQAPDEANIFFLLGKCYLKSGENVKATIAFTSARELQPKLEGPIKAAMENDGEEGDEEEEE